MAEFGKGPISGDLVHPEAEGFEGATAEDIEACREEHRKICERRGRRVMAGKILGKDLKVPDPSEDIPVRAGRFEEGDCLGVMPLVFRGKLVMVVNQASRAVSLLKRIFDHGLAPGRVFIATSQEYESFVGGDVTFMDVSDDAALAPEGSRERHYRCMDCGWSGPQSEAGVKPELSRIQLLCPSCLRPDTIKFES